MPAAAAPPPPPTGEHGADPLAVINLTGGNPPPLSPGAGALVVAGPANVAPPPLPLVVNAAPPPPAVAAPVVAVNLATVVAGLGALPPVPVTVEQADALVAGFKLDPAGNILVPKGKHGCEYNICKFLGLSNPIFQAIKVTFLTTSSSLVLITIHSATSAFGRSGFNSTLMRTSAAKTLSRSL
jgi:hypothetical protein